MKRNSLFFVCCMLVLLIGFVSAATYSFKDGKLVMDDGSEVIVSSLSASDYEAVLTGISGDKDALNYFVSEIEKVSDGTKKTAAYEAIASFMKAKDVEQKSQMTELEQMFDSLDAKALSKVMLEAKGDDLKDLSKELFRFLGKDKGRLEKANEFMNAFLKEKGFEKLEKFEFSEIPSESILDENSLTLENSYGYGISIPYDNIALKENLKAISAVDSWGNNVDVSLGLEGGSSFDLTGDFSFKSFEKKSGEYLFSDNCGGSISFKVGENIEYLKHEVYGDLKISGTASFVQDSIRTDKKVRFASGSLVDSSFELDAYDDGETIGNFEFSMLKDGGVAEVKVGPNEKPYWVSGSKDAGAFFYDVVGGKYDTYYVKGIDHANDANGVENGRFITIRGPPGFNADGWKVDSESLFGMNEDGSAKSVWGRRQKSSSSSSSNVATFRTQDGGLHYFYGREAVNEFSKSSTVPFSSSGGSSLGSATSDYSLTSSGQQLFVNNVNVRYSARRYAGGTEGLTKVDGFSQFKAIYKNAQGAYVYEGTDGNLYEVLSPGNRGTSLNHRQGQWGGNTGTGQVNGQGTCSGGNCGGQNSGTCSGGNCGGSNIGRYGNYGGGSTRRSGIFGGFFRRLFGRLFGRG